MAYLLDSSVLFRLANSLDPDHAAVQNALVRLRTQGESIFITAQNLIKFRNGATRPAKKNGLGLLPTVAAQESAKFEVLFPLLSETPAIYPAWKLLADAAGVAGKQVHDTRLVAVCHVHNITHNLTFNVKDFLRFENIGQGLVVIDPHTV